VLGSEEGSKLKKEVCYGPSRTKWGGGTRGACRRKGSFAKRQGGHRYLGGVLRNAKEPYQGNKKSKFSQKNREKERNQGRRIINLKPEKM